MMSFGAIAVDRWRPTEIFPGRSMLTGLIGNALGWRRQDGEKLQELQERIRYAVRIEHNSEPVTVRDYQTARIFKKEMVWTTSGKPEERKGGDGSYRGPEPRNLEYVVDSRAVVALRLESPEEHPTLEEVGYALRWPARPLHIGRKCCIPETMIFTRYRDAENATRALLEEPTRWTPNNLQWDIEEGDQDVREDREHWTSDLKDWSNRVHVGRRRVRQGTQPGSPEEEQTGN